MSSLKEILNKPLFKATSLNGLSIILKIIIGFITSKFIAVFVGPIGMALVGNLRNFLTSIEAIGTLGFENGVVKYVAESNQEKDKLKRTLSTTFISVLVSTIILSFLLLLFSNYFNTSIFGSNYHFSFIFIILAIALPFYIGNILVLAIINGLHQFQRVIKINIIGNILGLLFSVLLIWKLKTQGAFLSLIVTPTILFFIAFYFLNKELNLSDLIKKSNFDNGLVKKLSEYSLMAFVSAFFGSLILLLIRKNIITNLGITQAGYWEAICRISSYYFIFISSIISIYFLPKFSASKNYEETKKFCWEYYKNIIPVFLVGITAIYFLRNFIIEIVFTKEFMPTSSLFLWQLIGDFFKALSFVLAIQFYAKKLTVPFIIAELFSLLILYVSSRYFISIYKIEGVVIAHAFTYFIYFLCLSIYFRKNLV